MFDVRVRDAGHWAAWPHWVGRENGRGMQGERELQRGGHADWARLVKEGLHCNIFIWIVDRLVMHCILLPMDQSLDD